MPESPLSSSRKRRSELPQRNETSRPVSKRQRLSPPSGSQPPPAFWDNLSKIWLTKRALRELDRRNTQAAPTPPRSLYRARRPVTRNCLAKSKTNRQNTADYEPRILKDIKLFARHGGPDLSDLRNVCIAKYLSACAKADNSLVPRTCPPVRSRDELEFSEPTTTGLGNYLKHQAHHEYDKNKEYRGL
jgi:hypothetical protein